MGSLIDALTTHIIAVSRGVPVDRAGGVAHCTPETLDPAIFLLRVPDACAALQVSAKALTTLAKDMGLKRWPFNQLRRARAVAVQARHVPLRTAAARVRPVVRDALILGHTKRHARVVTAAAAASPPSPSPEPWPPAPKEEEEEEGSRLSLAKPTPEPLQRVRK